MERDLIPINETNFLDAPQLPITHNICALLFCSYPSGYICATYMTYYVCPNQLTPTLYSLMPF